MYSKGSAFPFTATLDTGTPANWISEEALGQLQIDTKVEAATSWLTFDNRTIRSKEVVKVAWAGDGSSNRKTRSTTFRVARHAPFDVIFGSELISSERLLSVDETAWILAKKPASKGTPCQWCGRELFRHLIWVAVTNRRRETNA
jgi:hypothetical protein